VATRVWSLRSALRSTTAGRDTAGLMRTAAKIASAAGLGIVSLGAVTVGPIVVGSPWPLIVIGGVAGLVLGTPSTPAGAGSADHLRARALRPPRRRPGAGRLAAGSSDPRRRQAA